MITAAESESDEIRLVKKLLQKEDIISMPIRSAGETVHAQLGINLQKIINLVWLLTINDA